MKDLKNMLQEAITPKAMDRLLLRRRQLIASKLKGDVADYVLTLERMLDILGQTSTKTDDHLKKFLQQWDREKDRERQSGTSGGIGKKKAKKKASKKKATTAKTTEPPGEDVDLSGLTDEPEGVSNVDLLDKMPHTAGLALAKPVKLGLGRSNKGNTSGGSKGKKDAFNKAAKASQYWAVGERVTVLGVSGEVAGGDRKGGWEIEGDSGKKYLFVPSKRPMYGRGIYDLSKGDPRNGTYRK